MKDEAIFRQLEPADYPQVKEVICEAFAEHVKQNPRALVEYEQEPWFDPGHLVVAEINGEIIGQMGVRDGWLWCDGTALPAGVVGTVCTREAHRGHGIGAKMVGRAFALMEELGLAVSYLHTEAARHGFYSRLGYKKAIVNPPRQRVDLRIDIPVMTELSTEGVEVRAALPDDAADLNDIYQIYYSGLSGAWSRTVPFWERRLAHRPKLWSEQMDFQLARQNGRTIAYLCSCETADMGMVAEWACMPGAEDAALKMLYQTLSAWKAKGLAGAQLSVVANAPLRPLLEELALRDETGEGVIFVRVQHVGRFVECVQPLLERRARTAGVRVVAHLSNDLENKGIAIEAGEGKLVEVEIDASDFCSLLYNGARLPGLINEGDVGVLNGDRDMLHGVFPLTGAARCALDGY